MTTSDSTANATRSRGGTWKWWLIAVVCAIVVFVGLGIRSDLANGRQDVLAQLGQTQNVMQRRNDVLTNMANTAMAGGKNDRTIQVGVAEARSQAKATNDYLAKIDMNKITQDPKLLEQFFAVMAQQQQAMIKLNSVVEAYPDIKSTGLFARVQDEIVGSENRVSVERGRTQRLILAYNKLITNSVKGAIVAKVFGYEQMAYFTASSSAQQAPDLGDIYKK